MNNTKANNAFRSNCFRLVGMLLLCIFIGRVVIVSVYGYAGVPKAPGGVYAQSAEQEDNDSKDESKYTQKQFKCFAPDVYVAPLLATVLLSAVLPNTCLANSYHAVSLVVPTPPPNC